MWGKFRESEINQQRPRVLSGELDKVAERIREIEGFTYFLNQPRAV
jgi:hypothetical protein